MRFLISMFAIFLFLEYSATAQKLNDEDLVMLKNFMSGNFSSEAQAKEDSNYLDIRVHLVPIWKERKDGFWLYLEQAVATSQDKPYRQRVYHIQLLNDSTVALSIYEMESPMRFAGEWNKEQPLSTLTLDAIKSKDGCTLYLQKNAEGNFKGRTKGKECISNLQGASFATSEILIQQDMFVSLQRGWNANEKQVWGALKGGYLFVRQK